jgi:hypothetical protein
MIIAPGSTSVSLDIQIVDDSGLPVTALVAATMPTISYAREREATANITLSDLALITTGYASGGVKERSAGYYRLDVPNAAFATASRVRVFGEASGKRVLCESIDVRVDGVTITPFQASSSNPVIVGRDRAPLLQHSAPADEWTITDAAGAAVNLTGKTVRYVVYSIEDENDEEDVFDDDLEGEWKYETGGSGVTISGASSNVVTVQHTAANNAEAGDYRYILWNVTDAIALVRGRLPIKPAVFDV